MKLTLAEPKLLVDSIGIISDLVNEVLLKVDKEKIELIAMDPANVAMVIFKLLSSTFNEYKVDKPLTLALSLDSLKSVLRRAKPTDILNIELDTDKNRLRVQLKGDSTRTFNLALIDLEDKEQKIPNLTFPLRVEMGSGVFDEAIQDMDIIADSVALVVEKNKFTVESESTLSDARTEIGNDDDTVIKSTLAEPVKAKYSIEYLKKIVKGSKLSPKVVLQFNKDYPLRADYVVKDKLSFSIILAPRVSND